MAAPTATWSFSPDTVAPGGTIRLNIGLAIQSSPVTALTGVALTSVLPSGLTVSSLASTTCNGTITNLAGLASSTATISACNTFENGPIRSFPTSATVQGKGYWMRFDPAAGETGSDYMRIGVLISDGSTTAAPNPYVYYVVNILPRPEGSLTNTILDANSASSGLGPDASGAFTDGGAISSRLSTAVPGSQRPRYERASAPS